MSLKLGKLPAIRPYGISDLAEYVKGKIPAPPTSIEYARNLKYPMDANDRYGDCVMAGVAHLIQAWDCEVKGKDPIPTEDEIVKEYFTLTGGDDVGLNESSVLSTWHRSGLFGRKIEAYAPIHFQNITTLHQCIAFYGGSLFGIQCPQSAQQQFGADEPWTIVPGSPIEGGHAIIAIGYDAQFVYCVTWGRVVKVTYPFLSAFLDEAYAVIAPQFVEAGKGPKLDIATLKSDLAALKVAA